MASIAFFDSKEDLKTYDLDYANKKIENFKSLADASFFFLRLLSGEFEEHWKATMGRHPATLWQKRREVKLKAYERNSFRKVRV